MGKNDSLDIYAIRKRLKDIKEEARMSNYEFCEIYAPEKCDPKKTSRADNYISAIFSGRAFPNEPVNPELVHLQNLVDSNKFPNVTLQYLIWGDETPVKTIRKVDTDPHNWTIADFCVFLSRLVDAHSPNIKIENIKEEESCSVSFDEEISETMHYIAIKILEYDGFATSGYDLGNAISEFVLQIEKMKQIPSKTAQKVMYDQLIKAIESDERFSKELLTSRGQDSFFKYDNDGLVFDGLEIG